MNSNKAAVPIATGSDDQIVRSSTTLRIEFEQFDNRFYSFLVPAFQISLLTMTIV